MLAIRSLRPTVHGLQLDARTRCLHWHGPLDIVAMKMRCCATYYACRECHDAAAPHAVQVWPHEEWDEKAVLCGACGHELTLNEYLSCENQCPRCGAGFNPGCHKHHNLYFAEGKAFGH